MLRYFGHKFNNWAASKTKTATLKHKKFGEGGSCLFLLDNIHKSPEVS